MRPLRTALVPAACAGLALCLGACATQDAAQGLPDPAPAPPPASASAAAASPIDGLYKGTSTRYQADKRDCPHPGLVNLYVQDRQFTYRWNRLTDVPAAIGPDGSVTGQDGTIALTGRQVGDSLTGDLTNGACALHFTAHRHFSGA